MSEFTDIMEQVKRMCKAHRDCTQCALYHVFTGGGCAFDYLFNVNFDDVEYKVNAWAKKHPDEDKPKLPGLRGENGGGLTRRPTLVRMTREELKK